MRSRGHVVEYDDSRSTASRYARLLRYIETTKEAALFFTRVERYDERRDVERSTPMR